MKNLRQLLKEASIELADGQTVNAFLRQLQEAVVSKIAALLPAAQPGPDGSLPYQYVDLKEATATDAIVCAVRYGEGDDSSFRLFFRVPYTVKAGVVEAGAPVSVEPRLIYQPLPSQMAEGVMEFPSDPVPRDPAKEIQLAIGGLYCNKPLEEAEEVLRTWSGKHPLAAKLGLAISYRKADTSYR